MPQDALPNGDAHGLVLAGPRSRVAEMQAKLHRWAVADAGRRFDDLFNFVYDPATLIVAFGRVAGNRGANTPGVDGLTVAEVEQSVGVLGFLDDLRAQLKPGTFRPLPVRERKIPKRAGREGAQAGHPDHRRPGRAGGAQAPTRLVVELDGTEPRQGRYDRLHFQICRHITVPAVPKPDRRIRPTCSARGAVRTSADRAVHARRLARYAVPDS